MIELPNEKLISMIRSEIKKYSDKKFANTDDFTCDIHLLSDDLTAIALSLEKQLRIRIDRAKYQEIHNVQEYAQLLSYELAARGPLDDSGCGGSSINSESP